MVNWFRQDENGKFLWPGFGDNMRVLKWILDRALGRVGAQETLLGWVPRDTDLDLTGVAVSDEQFAKAMKIDLDEWTEELESQGELFDKLGATLPKELALQREILRAKVARVRDTA